ncbi:MAG TPA: GNAT family N-acetyltransferase, partial [Candidatus Kapabacteria bacterium]
MSPENIRLAIKWASNEGWNPGLHDDECFYAADPNGFFIGKLNGEPIGCISAVKYEDKFGFVGLYIVKEEYRGKGYGIALWNKAMEYLAGCNAGLDGVVAQQENYKKSGFVLAHRNIRYELKEKPQEILLDKNIVPADAVSYNLLATYDKTHFLYSRDAFLRKWIEQPNAACHVYLEEGGIRGYGVIRECGNGFKIGPLFCDTPAIAKNLFASLVSTTSGGSIYLDVTELNPDAAELVEKYGMTKVFETARMYTHGDLCLPLKNIFGITSFELG